MSGDSPASGWVRRGRRWLSLASRDVLEGSQAVAFESDRWFLGAVRGVGDGAAHAQGGVDAVTHALAQAVAAEWARRRPSWMRQRTPRERIERVLRAEAKRHGFDVAQEEFRAFSGNIATLLELVYTRAVPLDAIAFEPASQAGLELDGLIHTAAGTTSDAAPAEQGLPDEGAQSSNSSKGLS